MCVVLRIILNKELIMYPERMNSISFNRWKWEKLPVEYNNNIHAQFVLVFVILRIVNSQTKLYLSEYIS